MSIDPRLFRTALGKFATGVTVVTVQAGSTKRGMTANAFSSVSLDPPLVLVCVDHQAVSLGLIREAKRFAVNILAEDQRPLSNWFAGKGHDVDDQFVDVPHDTGVNGSPILRGCLAALECDLQEEFPGGDHTIFVGRVTRIAAEGDSRPPLLYYASAYRKMDMGAAFED